MIEGSAILLERTITLTDEIQLKRTNWNDYGYLLTYEVYYQQNVVGGIKLISKDMFTGDTHSFENLNKDNYSSEVYFALPFYLDFYSELSKKVKEDEKYIRILKQLRIITEIDWENKHQFLKSFQSMEEKDLNFKTVSKNFIDVLCRDNDSVSILFYVILKSINEQLVASINLSDISDDQLNLLLYDAAMESKRSWTYPSTLLAYISKLYAENEKSFHILDLNSDTYDKLDDIVQKILTKLKIDIDEIEDNQRSLGHYSNLPVLKFLLNKKTEENNTIGHLRLTNAKQLNDPNEGVSLLKYIFPTNELSSTVADKDNKKIIEKGDYLTSTYLFSLTAKYDDLTMWNMYGDSARGVYLTLEHNFLKKLLEQPQVSIYQVVYINEDFFSEESRDEDNILSLVIELKHEVDAIKQKENLSEILRHLQPILYLFKADSYSFEEEYRIVYEHTNDSSLAIYEQQNKENYLPFLYVYLTYVETRYSEIMLGPKISESEYGYILPYILNNTANDVDIVKSNIEFR